MEIKFLRRQRSGELSEWPAEQDLLVEVVEIEEVEVVEVEVVQVVAVQALLSWLLPRAVEPLWSWFGSAAGPAGVKDPVTPTVITPGCLVKVAPANAWSRDFPSCPACLPGCDQVVLHVCLVVLHVSAWLRRNHLSFH